MRAMGHVVQLLLLLCGLALSSRVMPPKLTSDDSASVRREAADSRKQSADVGKKSGEGSSSVLAGASQEREREPEVLRQRKRRQKQRGKKGANADEPVASAPLNPPGVQTGRGGRRGKKTQLANANNVAVTNAQSEPAKKDVIEEDSDEMVEVHCWELVKKLVGKCWTFAGGFVESLWKAAGKLLKGHSEAQAEVTSDGGSMAGQVGSRDDLKESDVSELKDIDPKARMSGDSDGERAPDNLDGHMAPEASEVIDLALEANMAGKNDVKCGEDDQVEVTEGHLTGPRRREDRGRGRRHVKGQQKSVERPRVDEGARRVDGISEDSVEGGAALRLDEVTDVQPEAATSSENNVKSSEDETLSVDIVSSTSTQAPTSSPTLAPNPTYSSDDLVTESENRPPSAHVAERLEQAEIAVSVESEAKSSEDSVAGHEALSPEVASEVQPEAASSSDKEVKSGEDEAEAVGITSVTTHEPTFTRTLAPIPPEPSDRKTSSPTPGWASSDASDGVVVASEVQPEAASYSEKEVKSGEDEAEAVGTTSFTTHETTFTRTLAPSPQEPSDRKTSSPTLGRAPSDASDGVAVASEVQPEAASYSEKEVRSGEDEAEAVGITSFKTHEPTFTRTLAPSPQEPSDRKTSSPTLGRAPSDASDGGQSSIGRRTPRLSIQSPEFTPVAPRLRGGGYSNPETGSWMPFYVGTLKSYNVRSGYGRVECAETFAIYKTDVYIHKAQVPVSRQLGQLVEFAVTKNRYQHPQAINVMWLPQIVLDGNTRYDAQTHDKNAHFPERFIGTLYSFSVFQGQGFIASDSVPEKYSGQVYLTRDECPPFGPVTLGKVIEFEIVENAQGQPQAQHVDWDPVPYLRRVDSEASAEPALPEIEYAQVRNLDLILGCVRVGNNACAVQWALELQEASDRIDYVSFVLEHLGRPNFAIVGGLLEVTRASLLIALSKLLASASLTLEDGRVVAAVHWCDVILDFMDKIQLENFAPFVHMSLEKASKLRTYSSQATLFKNLLEKLYNIMARK